MKLRKVILQSVVLTGLSIVAQSLVFAANPAEKKLMDDARSAYQGEKLQQALELYEKIPQNSDYWVEALEERSWTHLRKNDTAKALSLITTLTSDLLAPQVGPEPYFLKTLIDYRLCNIKGIFEDFELFRKRYKLRNEEMNNLRDNRANMGTNKALEILKAKKEKLAELKADDFGSEMQYLPRFFYRDPTIIAAAQTESDKRILMRLSQLAEVESKEIDLILQKMHLLESQVVQQVFAYNKQMHEKSQAEFAAIDTKNNLVFPYQNQNEIWLDEIDSFEAATSECPVDPLKGAKP